MSEQVLCGCGHTREKHQGEIGTTYCRRCNCENYYPARKVMDLSTADLNAKKAHAFDVMVERGWDLGCTADGWVCYEGNLEISPKPMPTPLEAVLDAERRTKGGA